MSLHAAAQISGATYTFRLSMDHKISFPQGYHSSCNAAIQGISVAWKPDMAPKAMASRTGWEIRGVSEGLLGHIPQISRYNFRDMVIPK